LVGWVGWGSDEGRGGGGGGGGANVGAKAMQKSDITQNAYNDSLRRIKAPEDRQQIDRRGAANARGVGSGAWRVGGSTTPRKKNANGSHLEKQKHKVHEHNEVSAGPSAKTLAGGNEKFMAKRTANAISRKPKEHHNSGRENGSFKHWQ